MSVEEDVELRDLLTQTLESNGCLAKIRAQLRSSIFLALDEDPKTSKQEPLLNKKIKSSLETAEGRLMFCLVREFLEYFNLHFTISVFESESYSGNAYKYEGRTKLAADAALTNSNEALLMQLIQNRSQPNGVGETKVEDEEVKTVPLVLSAATKIIKAANNKPEIAQNLNATFDISNPTIKPSEESQTKSKETYRDDTYDETSSIAEDSAAQSNSELNGSENSAPILKDKTKKSSLSSLSDLPPLQLRGDVLPTAYSKEFKDKSNLRELDKLFDLEQEYEEDFICSGDFSSNTFGQDGKNGSKKLNGNVDGSETDTGNSISENLELNAD